MQSLIKSKTVETTEEQLARSCTLLTSRTAINADSVWYFSFCKNNNHQNCVIIN